MAKGGFREGAGKKTIDANRKKVTFFINPEEKEALKTTLLTIRETETLKKSAIPLQDTNQPIMRMECCDKVQAWGEGADGIPKIGEETFCVWCQKIGKIKAVL